MIKANTNILVYRQNSARFVREADGHTKGNGE